MSSEQALRDYETGKDSASGQVINVGGMERGLCLAGGTLLFKRFFRKPSLLTAAASAALLYRGTTGHCPLYQSGGIDTADNEHSDERSYGYHVAKTIHINKSPGELYSFWRDLENLPQVMSHLISVRQIDEQRSQWLAQSPLGKTLEWNSEITSDEPEKRIAWRSLPNSEVFTEGEVRFRTPTFGEGTELFVQIRYRPFGGTFAARILEFFDFGLQKQLEEDLRGFKQLMEAGERPKIGSTEQAAAST